MNSKPLRQLVRSWWVIIFCLITLTGYEQALKVTRLAKSDLQMRHQTLLAEIEREKALNTELLHQVNSQSDPAWIELVLMRVLGVIPEGQIKFFFRTPDSLK